jgi:hypothetical protein
MQSCLLIPILQPKEVLSMRLFTETRRKLIKAYSMLENKVSVTPIENTGIFRCSFFNIYKKSDCWIEEIYLTIAFTL